MRQSLAIEIIFRMSQVADFAVVRGQHRAAFRGRLPPSGKVCNLIPRSEAHGVELTLLRHPCQFPLSLPLVEKSFVALSDAAPYEMVPDGPTGARMLL